MRKVAKWMCGITVQLMISRGAGDASAAGVEGDKS